MRSPWMLAEPLLVEREAHRRVSVDPATCQAIVVSAGGVLTQDGRLVFLEPDEHPPAALSLYLGNSQGRDIVAIVPEPGWETPAAHTRAGLRDFLVFDDAAHVARDRELAATAVALSTWHENHPRCAVCGEATVPRPGGWVRWCERDGREHYPRTDPSVIVAITDPDDRLLIAHASYWSVRRFSHLAGYVEPGESLEQAAHREVFEEAGLHLKDLTYFGSQPWPFPASLMAGFTARVEDPTLVLDNDEIAEARFVTREELSALVADGVVLVPPHITIARWLMDAWHGGDLG